VVVDVKDLIVAADVANCVDVEPSFHFLKIENALGVVLPVPSDAETVKLNVVPADAYVPPAEDVPEMVLVLNVTPVGNAPEVTEYDTLLPSESVAERVTADIAVPS